MFGVELCYLSHSLWELCRTLPAFQLVCELLLQLNTLHLINFSSKSLKYDMLVLQHFACQFPLCLIERKGLFTAPNPISDDASTG